MTGRPIAWAAAVSLLLGAAVAHAQSPDDLARARTHFEAGRALYRLGNYSDAVREFSAGYHLVPKPQFLINIGQCYLKLNDPENARKMYQQYLDEAPPSDVERAPAQAMLADIERMIRERPAQPPPVVGAPPAGTLAPPPPTVRGTAVPPGAVLVGEPPPRKKPFLARHWWIFPVGAAVVTGVAVGLYFGLKSDCTASLGCIPVHGQ